jgi:excisionase family DNA binding protein
LVGEISSSSEEEPWRDFFMGPSNTSGGGMIPNIVTAKEVGQYLKLSESTIYKLAASGEIPGFKIGDSWRFDMEEILKMIRESKIGSSRGSAGPGGMQNGGIRKGPGIRG